MKRTKIEVGDKLKCIFVSTLPENETGPAASGLQLNQEYPCLQVFTDAGGNDHIDVGLVRNPDKVGYVTSYATKQKLPGMTHWCHPNRFIIVND